MIIADEVICGFGRTGNWFGSETMGIKPHIMTIAKGLSSGYQPIGGSIVCDEIAHTIGSGEFNHGYTYSGHPVCSAVALENLRIMQDEKILDHVNNVAAPALQEGLANLVMRHVGDRMIISPPLVITPEEIKIFMSRATKALDETYAAVKEGNLLKAAEDHAHDAESPLG